MHTLGEDFNFEDARKYFKNIDRIVNYVNSNKDKFNVTIQYSTPSK
jgi:hypothetical protein